MQISKSVVYVFHISYRIAFVKIQINLQPFPPFFNCKPSTISVRNGRIHVPVYFTISCRLHTAVIRYELIELFIHDVRYDLNKNQSTFVKKLRLSVITQSYAYNCPMHAITFCVESTDKLLGVKYQCEQMSN